MVRDDPKRRRLSRLLPEFESDSIREYALYRREQRGTPRIEPLIDHLQATMDA